MNELYEKLKNDFKQNISDLTREITTLTEKVSNQDETIKTLSDEMAKLQTQNCILKDQIKNCNNKIAEFEDRSRRNNLRIKGIPEEVKSSNLIEYVYEFVSQFVDAPTLWNSPFERIHRLFRSGNSSNPDPRETTGDVQCLLANSDMELDMIYSRKRIAGDADEVIRMKISTPCHYSMKLFVILILTCTPTGLSGSDSFRTQVVKFIRVNGYAQLVNTTVPELKDFTLCVDLNRGTSTQIWTAFSYKETANNHEYPDLGLAGSNKILYIYYLAEKHEVDHALPLSYWHNVCIIQTWNSLKKSLEVYVNGSSVYIHKTIKQLKGNGTLVLGINHIIKEGQVIPVDSFSYIGKLYNFQLWDYTRPPDLLDDCTNGNIVNWTKGFWKFDQSRLTEDSNLRCGTVASPLYTTIETPTTRLTSESVSSTSIVSSTVNKSSTQDTLPSSTSTTTEATTHKNDIITAVSIKLASRVTVFRDTSPPSGEPAEGLPTRVTGCSSSWLFTWLRTAPSPNMEVSVWTRKRLLKFGVANKGASPRACFSYSNASLHSGDHQTVRERDFFVSFRDWVGSLAKGGLPLGVYEVDGKGPADGECGEQGGSGLQEYLKLQAASAGPLPQRWWLRTCVASCGQRGLSNEPILCAYPWASRNCLRSSSGVDKGTPKIGLGSVDNPLALSNSTKTATSSSFLRPLASCPLRPSSFSNGTTSPWSYFTSKPQQDGTTKSPIMETSSSVDITTVVGDSSAVTSPSEKETTSVSKPPTVTSTDSSFSSTTITRKPSENLTITQTATHVSSSVYNGTTSPWPHFSTKLQQNGTINNTKTPDTETASPVVTTKVGDSVLTLSTVPSIVESETVSVANPPPATSTDRSFSSTTITKTPSDNLTITQTSTHVSSSVSNGTTSPWSHLSTKPQQDRTTKSPIMETSSSVGVTTKVGDSSAVTSSSQKETTSVSKPPTVTSTVNTADVLTTPNTTTQSTSIVTFYVVSMDISILGTNGFIDVEKATDITKKLMDQIFKDTGFSVVQFIIYDETSYKSKVIIQAISPDTPKSLAGKLKDLLDNQDHSNAKLNLSLSVNSAQHIVPGSCPPESTYSYDKGVYKWMETKPTETAWTPCSKNFDMGGTRYCNINVANEKAEWELPNLEICLSVDQLPDTIQDLETVDVTPANALFLAMHIYNLTSNLDKISEKDTDIILTKISKIIEVGENDVSTAKTTLDIIDFILLKAVNLRGFTNRILNIIEDTGYKMDFPGDTVNITAQTVAVSVTKVTFMKFEGMFFSVKSYLEGTYPEITLQRVPIDTAVAFIHLPGTIQNHASTSTSKVQFNFFGRTSLFEDDSNRDAILNTYVVSASVENTQIEQLKDPVDITLRHISQTENKDRVQCVFWDFHMNGGKGGWNTSGCTTTFTNTNYTTCNCSHLTHFGVLLDISRSKINPFDAYILSLLSYVGCGIGSLFLGVALVTYLSFKQLRRDYPAKILINLSASLLMLNLVFLVNSWLASFRNYGLCISGGVLLHYFLLTSFTWMGLEAVHMYFAFVKVFNLYIHNYILKFAIAGWGIPAVIIGIVLIINVDFYGQVSLYKQSEDSTDITDLVCWIQNDIVFYLTVVAYFCIIFLINISMFIVVLIQINSLKSKRKRDWRAIFLHDIKGTISLAFLLGLTWGFAFFAWDPVKIAFMYLFAIFNTLQGLFIFVFHCLIKENVRKQWKMHLCCGKFRFDNYSDWSRLSNGEGGPNGRIRTSPSDSFQSTRSNATASTSNSSSLSGFSRDDFSGRGYVNGRLD
ncbi:adhesion G-protein coupled receptor G4 [Pelodytes ibericus]